MKGTIVPKKEQNERTIKYTNLLNFLAKYPYDSFSLTELAKKAGISKSSVSRMLKPMENGGLVRVSTIANIFRIQFNIENPYAIGYKIGANLTGIYTSGIVEYVKLHFPGSKSIILFGSFRKGEDGPSSDVDIAIETAEEKEMEILEITHDNSELVKRLEQWQQGAERKFKLHIFHRNKINRNLFINVANGIILSGLLEVKP